MRVWLWWTSRTAWVCACLSLWLSAPVFAQKLRAFQEPGPFGKPNVLVILANDLGYGDLGSYGQTRIQTPHLDQLAAGGMRFTQAYAGNALNAPSRAALITGTHSGHNRIRGNADLPLAPEDYTLAEFLKANGYNTCALGKWALGLHQTSGEPFRQGFDEWFGFLSLREAFQPYPALIWRQDQQWMVPGNQNGAKGDYACDWFERAATNYFRINSQYPFFVFLALPLPQANLELATRTGNGYDVPSVAPYARENWPAPAKNRAAMITLLDRYVGALMNRLRELKIERQTLVLFTSDNGPDSEGGVDPAFFKSAGPWRGGKRDLTEGGLRVPLIAHWPGRIQPGIVSDQLVAHWDVFPTVTEAVTTNRTVGLDGISFLPTLLGKPQTNQHDYLYWELHENGVRQALRFGDWKVLRSGAGSPVELYGLKTDLRETNNLAATQPQLVKQAEKWLYQARVDAPQWPLLTNSPPVRLP
jgi:uncharacterized sulfatase